MQGLRGEGDGMLWAKSTPMFSLLPDWQLVSERYEKAVWRGLVVFKLCSLEP